MNINIAEKFKAQLEASAGTGEFAGYPLRLRRARSKVKFARGDLPMYFADIYRQTLGVETSTGEHETQDKKISAAEYDEFAKYQLEVIIDSCIEPKIKKSADQPGDVLIDDVPDEVLEFIWLYATNQADFPGSAEKEEVVTAATLVPFLHDGEGQDESNRDGQRRETVRVSTKRNARKRA